MPVEERPGNDKPKDQFPVGMHVLAVDDDPTCLMLLGNLLRRCRYHVTTTNQAIKALKLLRENRNNFDMVITDVHMPDMDGFKLLEFVGLEMDIPVIMLSVDGDNDVVRKGLTHGAVDYMLKPVRIQEVKVLWKHVFGRRKPHSKDQNNSKNPEKTHGSGEGAQGNPGGNADINAKQNGKRKYQNEDDADDFEDNGHENEDQDQATQKKARVVWSVELHHKFVAAVNQLGIDKAVPKRILDLMNVENLSRENVASHLQKYRLKLKRTSCPSQQVTMVAALGGNDPSYLRMGSLDGLGDFHASNGSGQLHNAAFTSLPPAGMLGRLNSPAGLGMRGLAPSGMIQLGQARNSRIPLNDLGNPEPFDIGASVSTHAPDQNICNDNWRSSVPLTGFPSNSLPLSTPFSHADLPPSNLRDTISPMGSHIGNNPLDISSSSVVPTPLQDSRRDVQCQESILIGNIILNDSPKFSNFGGMGNNLDQNVNYAPMQRWEDHKQDYIHNSNLLFSSMNSSLPTHGVISPLTQNLDQNNAVCNLNFDTTLLGQSNAGVPYLMQHNEVEKSTLDTTIRLEEEYSMEQTKPQGGFISNSFGSLEDPIAAMINQGQQESEVNGEGIEYEDYLLGTCM